MKNKPQWDFPVEIRPCPGSQGNYLVRTDTNTNISFVTNQYNLVTHRDAVNMLERQFKQYGLPISQLSYNMYGTMGTSVQLNYKIGEQVIVKDEYNVVISITNGYDRLTKLTLAFGLERLVCSNGLIAVENKYRMSVRHMGDTFESIEKFLQRGEEYVKKSTTEFQRMLRAKPTLEPIGVTKNEYDAMSEAGLFKKYFDELGKNMYAEFQAYSDFFSNYLEGNKQYKYERNILPNFIKLLNA